jgi:hypothetical protein
MIDLRPYKPGARVRLLSSSHVVELKTPFGFIVRPDDWDE